MHVLWPSAISPLRSGYLLGWRFSKDIVCILAVYSAEEISMMKRDWSSFNMPATIEQPIVLGVCTCDGEPTGGAARTEALRAHASIWLDVLLDGAGKPAVNVSQLTSEAAVGCNVLQYDPSNTYSLRQSLLDHSPDGILAKATTWSAIVAQTLQPAIGKEEAKDRFPVKTSPSLIYYPTIFFLICLRAGYGVFAFIIQKSPLHSLLDCSKVARQLGFRSEQICRMPQKYADLADDSGQFRPGKDSQSYFELHNQLWLAINDVVLGSMVGAVLIEFAPTISMYLGATLRSHTISYYESTIVWLMGWPAGMKLNNSLDKFLGELYLWLIGIWTNFLIIGAPHLEALVMITGACGFVGFSILVALVSDLISIFTLHLLIFYFIASRMYHWQLAVLTSLFHLFRGKKWNVLRERLDSTDYALDQLLLGAVLCTLLFFIFPTVLVYYLLFLSSRMAILSIHVVLDVLLVCLNHWPLFALVGRMKGAHWTPADFRFTLPSLAPESKNAAMALKTKSISYGTIFEELAGKCRHVFAPVLSRHAIWSVFSGIALRHSLVPTVRLFEHDSRPPSIAHFCNFVWRFFS